MLPNSNLLLTVPRGGGSAIPLDSLLLRQEYTDDSLVDTSPNPLTPVGYGNYTFENGLFGRRIKTGTTGRISLGNAVKINSLTAPGTGEFTILFIGLDCINYPNTYPHLFGHYNAASPYAGFALATGSTAAQRSLAQYISNGGGWQDLGYDLLEPIPCIGIGQRASDGAALAFLGGASQALARTFPADKLATAYPSLFDRADCTGFYAANVGCDEVMIFGKLLTAEEVKAIYAEVCGLPTKGTARYWRIVGAGSSYSQSGRWHTALSEIQMFGSNDCSGTNLCLGKEATASSIFSASYPANNALDGNVETHWSTASSQTTPQWWRVDMGSPVAVRSLAIRTYSTTYHPRAVKLQYSTDDINWITQSYFMPTNSGAALLTFNDL